MSQEAPFFSVIIPAYNCERFLGETIESVLAQTFRDFEIVVCDNASTDGTAEVIKGYEDQVRSVRLEENRGPAGGRNAALAAARGQYMAFLDGDDLWAPDKLEQCYWVIREREAKFVFSNLVTINAQGRVGAPSVPPRRGQRVIPPKDPLLLLVNFISCSSAVVSRQLLPSQPFNEDPPLRTLEDHLLWMQINRETPLHYIPAPLLRYRVHQANATIFHRDLPRLQRYLDVVEEQGLYPPEIMELVRKITRLRMAVYEGRRVDALRGLMSLLWKSRGDQRRLLREWLLFYLRHLRAGAVHKWVTWPLTGRTRDHFQPARS